jgi:hypothetical protein
MGKQSTMKTIAHILLLLLVTAVVSAQSGLNIYAGISNATSRDALITPEGTSHPGYVLGADARLNADDMYFMLGGQYHQIDFLAQDEKSFFSVDEKMTWLKIRVGLGYNLVHIGNKITIRAKTLGSLNLISSTPELDSAPYSGTPYNSGTAGGVLGLGVDVFGLTMEVEYERGFFNAVNQVEGTQYDFLIVTLGYFF